MRNRKSILFQTFIGIPAEIIKSSSRNLVGLRGRIIDETKNMIVLETAVGEKRIPKIACTFRFALDSGGHVDVEGRKILYRPEDRPKKVG